MDLADASLLWLAHESGLREIMTVDVQDFARYRLPDGEALRREGEFQLAQTGLDRQLPGADQADQALVFLIGQRRSGFRRQSANG
jgi:hypothetical protein